MLDLKGMILHHVAAMWRRRWYAIVIAWAVCTGGWVYVAFLPDQYDAKARVYVDTDSMLRPLLRGLAIDSNLMNEVDLMQRTLLSRPNLTRVARMADLDLAAKSPLEQETVVTNLERGIRISSQGRNLFSITYQGTNPDVAKKVVQSLLNIFVESNLGASRKDMVQARSFLDDQIRDYERQLDQAEQRVAKFKSENMGVLGGDAGHAAKLEQARNERERTNGDLAETRRKRDELKRQLAAVPQYIEVVNADTGGPPIGFGGFGGPSVGRPSDTAQKISELDQRLKALMLRYTERHPDVIETKRLLEIMKAEVEEEQKKKEEGPAPDSGDSPVRTVTTTQSNPVYERLKLQLIEEEAKIASLDGRLERNEADVRRWEEAAKSVPAVAAELGRLTRDYDVIRRNYNELISRREAAKIGQEIETQTKNIQFRLIDPPEVPQKPTGPNRPLFLSIVFVFGLGAGLAFAFLLGQLDSSIRNVEQLRAAMKLPVLGSISAIRSAWDRRRRLMAGLAYGTICLALGGAYLGLLTIEMYLRHRA